MCLVPAVLKVLAKNKLCVKRESWREKGGAFAYILSILKQGVHLKQNKSRREKVIFF